MSPELVSAFTNFGIGGLLLGIIAFFAYLVFTKIVVPNAEVARQNSLTQQAIWSKLAEGVGAIGLVAANTDKGVTTLMVSSQLWEVEFTTKRKAGRCEAHIIAVIAEMPGLPEDIKEQLIALSGRLYQIWDDGSKEMRALTKEDEQKYKSRI